MSCTRRITIECRGDIYVKCKPGNMQCLEISNWSILCGVQKYQVGITFNVFYTFCLTFEKFLRLFSSLR